MCSLPLEEPPLSDRQIAEEVARLAGITYKGKSYLRRCFSCNKNNAGALFFYHCTSVSDPSGFLGDTSTNGKYVRVFFNVQVTIAVGGGYWTVIGAIEFEGSQTSSSVLKRLQRLYGDTETCVNLYTLRGIFPIYSWVNINLVHRRCLRDRASFANPQVRILEAHASSSRFKQQWLTDLRSYLEQNTDHACIAVKVAKLCEFHGASLEELTSIIPELMPHFNSQGHSVTDISRDTVQSDDLRKVCLKGGNSLIGRKSTSAIDTTDWYKEFLSEIPGGLADAPPTCSERRVEIANPRTRAVLNDLDDDSIGHPSRGAVHTPCGDRVADQAVSPVEVYVEHVGCMLSEPLRKKRAIEDERWREEMRQEWKDIKQRVIQFVKKLHLEGRPM